MTTPAAASAGTAATSTPAAASEALGAAAAGAATAGGAAGAASTPPAGTSASAAGKPAEGKPAAEGQAPDKPAADPAPSEAERRLLAQVGKASAAERKAAKEVTEARAKIAELEKTIAGHGTTAERAKAADELETSLKDLKGAVKLLAKHGHKFEDVVKAWGDAGEESPEVAEIRKETAALREAQEKRDKAEADAKKERETADQRAAYAEGVKQARDILVGADPEFKETAAKRWRLSSSPDDADEVVESALASVRSHVAEKKAANKDYAPTEEQIRGLFVKTLDQAEEHLRGKAKRYAERLAEEANTTEAAKVEEARTAVAEAGAVTPRTTGKGREVGRPVTPLGAKVPVEDEGARTISAEVRGALPVPEPKKAAMSGGKREVGRPVQSLSRG